MWYFYPTEGESLNFHICRETLSYPVPSFSGIFWSPHEENPEGGWYTAVIFFESKKFTACKIKDKKEETFDGVQSTQDYPSIWK